MGSPILELRARPSQARSVATFNEILDTAGEMLETHGFDAVTTNLIADEAAISVRAIYRYFPNKHAIVVELARRMAAQWSNALEGIGSFADPDQPWSTLWCEYIDRFVAAVRATPGGRAVLLAMRNDPDLRRVDDEANGVYIAGISSALRSREPTMAGSVADAVAAVLMRSTVAVIDEAFDRDDGTGAELIDVMLVMHVGLLEQYLGVDQEPVTGGKQ